MQGKTIHDALGQAAAGAADSLQYFLSERGADHLLKADVRDLLRLCVETIDFACCKCGVTLKTPVSWSEDGEEMRWTLTVKPVYGSETPTE